MGRITISNAVLFLVLLAARAAAAWPTVGRIAMTKRSPPAAAATASKLDPLLFGTVAKRSPSVEVGAGAARHSGFDVRLPSLTTLGSTHGEALKTRYKLKLAEVKQSLKFRGTVVRAGVQTVLQQRLHSIQTAVGDAWMLIDDDMDAADSTVSIDSVPR